MNGELKELLELLLTERISNLAEQRRMEKGDEEEKERRFQEWEEFMEEVGPEIAGKCQNFLDWLTADEGEEVEDFYLHGLKDGIRIMRWIMKL